MRILIVDDDSIVALSLKTILEAKGLEICAMGNSGQQAIELYRQHKPDVLLMDIRMENMTGLEAAEKILSEDKSAKILFLTTFSDDEYILKALNIGAKGYILKQDFESIEAALIAVERGQSVFGGEIVSKLPDLMQHKSGFNYEAQGISPKEWEITTLVAEGLSNKEIAIRLYLSEGTVRNYISSVLEKLELRDRTQLAVFYYQKCGK
ncbi:MAG: response regulator [Ruminiclostridium sp.]